MWQGGSGSRPHETASIWKGIIMNNPSYPAAIDSLKTLVFNGKKALKEYVKNEFGIKSFDWEEYTAYYGNGLYAIYIDKFRFDYEIIDENGNLIVKPSEDPKWLRERDNMLDYIHSGAGLKAYYEDQEAGYVE